MFRKPSASNVPFHWNERQNYADIKQLSFFHWLESCFIHELFTCKHADVCFFPPLFISNLVLLKLDVVSRCPSDGDKENERGLDIISIEMILLLVPLLRHSHNAGSSHCTTFSTCKWQCHQMLCFHQSSRGVMNIQKAKRRLTASRSSTWPNYTGSGFSCESPLFVSV